MAQELEVNTEAVLHAWMTGFDAMFDQVYFGEITDYKVARDKIGIFACRSEWSESHPEISICGYSHDYIKKNVFGLDPKDRSPFYSLFPEASYMQGAYAAAQALEMENV